MPATCLSPRPTLAGRLYRMLKDTSPGFQRLFARAVEQRRLLPDEAALFCAGIPSALTPLALVVLGGAAELSADRAGLKLGVHHDATGLRYSLEARYAPPGVYCLSSNSPPQEAALLTFCQRELAGVFFACGLRLPACVTSVAAVTRSLPPALAQIFLHEPVHIHWLAGRPMMRYSHDKTV
jgi:hypothetical protein